MAWSKINLGSILVMMYGLPATGKSTTSRKILEHFSQKCKIEILASLHIRKKYNLFKLDDNGQREMVYDLLIDSIDQIMQNDFDIIIVDGNFHNKIYRLRLYELCIKNGYDVYVMHCVVQSEDEIVRRLDFRKKHSYVLENKADSISLFNLIRDQMDSINEDYRFDGLPIPRIVIDTEGLSFCIPNFAMLNSKMKRHIEILSQPFRKIYGFDEKNSINYM